MEATLKLEYKVKGLEELRVELDKRSHLQRVELQQKIDAMKAFQETYALKEAELFAKVPVIISTLEKLGLGVGSLGHWKTGMNNKEWASQDKLKVSITAFPISKKFKFIKDTGYTARGSGKNQKQLDEKSEKLRNIIAEGTKIESVHVNSFSLEYKNENDPKSVLIELYI